MRLEADEVRVRILSSRIHDLAKMILLHCEENPLTNLLLDVVEETSQVWLDWFSPREQES